MQDENHVTDPERKLCPCEELSLRTIEGLFYDILTDAELQTPLAPNLEKSAKLVCTSENFLVGTSIDLVNVRLSYLSYVRALHIRVVSQADKGF